MSHAIDSMKIDRGIAMTQKQSDTYRDSLGWTDTYVTQRDPTGRGTDVPDRAVDNTEIGRGIAITHKQSDAHRRSYGWTDSYSEKGRTGHQQREGRDRGIYWFRPVVADYPDIALYHLHWS